MPEFVHPCLSEQLTPSLFNGHLNTVYTTQDTHDKATKSGYPMTPFMQLNPAINQEARMNAVFVERLQGLGGVSSWQPCTDWENPIFGCELFSFAFCFMTFVKQCAPVVCVLTDADQGASSTTRTRLCNSLPLTAPFTPLVNLVVQAGRLSRSNGYHSILRPRDKAKYLRNSRL